MKKVAVIMGSDSDLPNVRFFNRVINILNLICLKSCPNALI